MHVKRVLGLLLVMAVAAATFSTPAAASDPSESTTERSSCAATSSESSQRTIKKRQSRKQKPAAIIASDQEWPESAEFHRGSVYVSNLGGAQIDFASIDGNGSISKYSADGELIDANFLPQDDGVLNAPKGITVVGNKLVVVDVTRVLAFDLASQKQVFEIDLADQGAVFLNGIDKKNWHTVFVSDSETGEIHEVSIRSGKVSKVDVEPIPGANGLAYDRSRRRLFVASLGPTSDFSVGGQLGVIRFKRNSTSYRDFGLCEAGNLDGIRLVGKTIVYSTWDFAGTGTGKLMAFDLRTKTVSPVAGIDGVVGYADFDVDRRTNTLWGATLFGGEVVRIPLQVR